MTRLIGTPTPGPQTSGGGIGNCPGNITLTQNPYTVDDTAGKLFVTLNRTNGSLGPAQLTLGTNLLAPGSGSATAADLGLILPSMPLYNDIYDVWGNIYRTGPMVGGRATAIMDLIMPSNPSGTFTIRRS